LLGLTRQDVDLDNLVLLVHGKANKQRLVPVSIELRKVLYRHLAKQKHARLFTTRSGAVLTARNSQRDFKVMCGKAGITGVRASWHTLRHSFAVNYFAEGRKPVLLAANLGALVHHPERSGPCGAWGLRIYNGCTMGYRCCLMDDITKIAVGGACGGVGGFFVGVLTEPIKLHFQRKSKISQMEIALYRELASNYESLLLYSRASQKLEAGHHMYVHDIQIKETVLNQLRQDYLYAQLPNIRSIEQIYQVFASFKGLGEERRVSIALRHSQMEFTEFYSLRVC
jgi:hypothetical protein